MLTGNFTADFLFALFLAVLMFVPLKTGLSVGSALLIGLVWVLRSFADWLFCVYLAADAGVVKFLQVRRHPPSESEALDEYETIRAARATAQQKTQPVEARS